MATGKNKQTKTLQWRLAAGTCDLPLPVCVFRPWASCCFLITSQTAWSIFLTWSTTSGTTPETDPQTWVGPVTLHPLLLLLTPSCLLFITTPTLSDLLPPRLLPTPHLRFVLFQVMAAQHFNTSLPGVTKDFKAKQIFFFMVINQMNTVVVQLREKLHDSRKLEESPPHVSQPAAFYVLLFCVIHLSFFF